MQPHDRVVFTEKISDLDEDDDEPFFIPAGQKGEYLGFSASGRALFDMDGEIVAVDPVDLSAVEVLRNNRWRFISPTLARTVALGVGVAALLLALGDFRPTAAQFGVKRCHGRVMPTGSESFPRQSHE